MDTSEIKEIRQTRKYNETTFTWYSYRYKELESDAFDPIQSGTSAKDRKKIKTMIKNTLLKKISNNQSKLTA